MDFKNEINEKLSAYIEKNNNCLELSQQLNRLKEDKQELEHNIIDFMEQNNMSHKIFVLNEHKIQHKTICQYQNITLKLIENSLREYSEMNSIPINVEEYMLYIKDKRDKKHKDELKIQ